MMEGSVALLNLVLLRHFPSEWNDPNDRRFTGRIDLPLSPDAYRQGIEVGKRLAERGFVFDIACTSALRRAEQSLAAVIEGLGAFAGEIERSHSLVERSYGALEGMRHTEARERYGGAQVHAWRRSFTERPPDGESLQDVYVRVLSYWANVSFNHLFKGKRLLVVAHGNSLRALFMHLAKLDGDTVESFELPTGAPLVCELDQATLALQRYFYL